MWILLCGLLLQSETRFVHENPAFEVSLPSAKWVPRDQGQPGILACVIAPEPDLSTRCSILRFSKSVLPAGLDTREEQIAAAASKRYQRTSMGPGKIAGREALLWQYQVGASTTFEWAFEDAGAWVIFQIAAPDSTWGDAAQRAELERMRDSFVWRGGPLAPAAPFDATPPEQVRQSRAAAASATQRSFAVTQHRIVATIEPDAHTIDVDDTIVVEALQDGVRQVSLYSTLVTIDDVTADVPLEWRIDQQPNANTLIVELKNPLTAHATVTLLVHATCADFFRAMDQEQVQEISVFGQIRSKSSYSSHVLWYPMDGWNDAAVDITFDVPSPYVALTGGELVDREQLGDRRTYHYVEKRRARRQLPFGFAVGNYVSREANSAAGLRYSVWGFPGDEPLLEQRLPIIGQAVAAFERAFGPLAWRDVRFVHVQPERKQTGVSLPGLILISNGFFTDVTGVDLSDGNLSRPAALSVLILADELSHQWNFYASSFPNELAEGISTFTNALFVESRHGADAYRNTLRYCRDAWIGSAGGETEFAIANPAVYSNARYRPVVFCKTPVVLHALRMRLGDDVFFKGMRGAFEIADSSIDGFVRLERGFSAAAGRDLHAFFEQWFFRAGFPTLGAEHVATANGVRVTLRQTQSEATYDLQVGVRVACEDGSAHDFTAELREREQSFVWPLPSPPRSVTLGSDGTPPVRIAAAK